MRERQSKVEAMRAVRIHIPLRTWRQYIARGSASTSGAISSRRGSGCIRIAPGFIADISRRPILKRDVSMRALSPLLSSHSSWMRVM